MSEACNSYLLIMLLKVRLLNMSEGCVFSFLLMQIPSRYERHCLNSLDISEGDTRVLNIEEFGRLE